VSTREEAAFRDDNRRLGDEQRRREIPNVVTNNGEQRTVVQTFKLIQNQTAVGQFSAFRATGGHSHSDLTASTCPPAHVAALWFVVAASRSKRLSWVCKTPSAARAMVVDKPRRSCDDAGTALQLEVAVMPDVISSACIGRASLSQLISHFLVIIEPAWWKSTEIVENAVAA